MIAYLKGELVVKSEEYIIIEVQGIGYKVFMSKKSIDELQENRQVRVYTYLKVREDDISWFALAVITNEVNTLKKLPGIGPKTAQRIILELKDKIKTEEAIGAETSELEKEENKQEEFEEVIQALQVLGYRRYEINKILPKIKSESLEERIKEALQYLAIAQ